MMPLVTRRVNQGRFWVQDTEPTLSWSNGDLWHDTLNEIVFKNNGGIAEPVGEEAALIYG